MSSMFENCKRSLGLRFSKDFQGKASQRYFFSHIVLAPCERGCSLEARTVVAFPLFNVSFSCCSSSSRQVLFCPCSTLAMTPVCLGLKSVGKLEILRTQKQLPCTSLNQFFCFRGVTCHLHRRHVVTPPLPPLL